MADLESELTGPADHPKTSVRDKIAALQHTYFNGCALDGKFGCLVVDRDEVLAILDASAEYSRGIAADDGV